MIRLTLATALIAYVPGALLYRLPTSDRTRRAALPPEERVFWHVVLSVAWSLAVVVALAWLGRYRFDRLLVADAALSAAVLVACRGRLFYRGLARRPTWTAALPIALVVLGFVQFLPASEYIIGGKDPGTYLNEGVQIAQRGSIVIHDPVVAAVPDVATPLFFPLALGQPYDSLRFMGFFIRHLRDGEVVGQLPHLFPASIAIGYGLNGLTGARVAVAAWAMLGLVAVYAFGARTFGPAPAIGAAALLAFNVVDVWFGRYPNSEVAMQALSFAALLAYSRAHQDEQAFFGPVAGVLVTLLVFARLDGLLVAAALAGTIVLTWIATGMKPRAGFVVTLLAGMSIGLAYLAGPLRAYFQTPLNFTDQISRPYAALVVVATAALLAALVWLRRRHAARVRRVVPAAIALVLIAAAAYALFLRAPGGKLTEYDAYALRTFAQFFLFPSALAIALTGLALVAATSFWRAPAFPVVFAAFALVFFYKIHVVPEHFWMERRTLPIILPGALLLAAVAAVGEVAGGRRTWRTARLVAGSAFLLWLGAQYAIASQPLRSHVEYAGIIPYLEQLAGKIGDRDLTIVESRDAGPDTHVFAVPLAYIYARNVLVLASPKPDKLRLEAFIEDARQKYDRVLFLGGQGTDLLSRRIVAAPLADGRVQVPEYASTPWNVYPEGARRKDFDYSLYELSLGDRGTAVGFHLDLGDRDDLFVVRFNAKERSEGRSVRWTGPTSYISMPGLSGAEREVVLTMHDGGRPAAAGPARVTVRFNGTIIGTTDVKAGFREYRFPIPAELARAAGEAVEPAQLTLESTVWVPRDYLGGNDTRRLGVMIDRVDVN
jgi:hypothetical protein